MSAVLNNPSENETLDLIEVDRSNRRTKHADEKLSPLAMLPFMAVHVACIGIFFFGFSWAAVILFLVLYQARIFFITGVYHRYFSHKTYRTSRFVQFLLGFGGTTAAQMGPLWWAAHHRHHHRYSDLEEDIHSPITRSFFWSHMGWIMCPKNHRTRLELIQDFAKFPELKFINYYHYLGPICLATFCFGLGELLAYLAPGWGTNGFQFLFIGFFLCTTVLYHSTFLINSVTHLWGTRRFKTKDDSRNNFLLALITMGEGWHNNHHRYPQSERNGFYWWEIDVTHYTLWTLSKLGIVWDLQKVPPHVYEEAREIRRLKSQKPRV